MRKNKYLSALCHWVLIGLWGFSADVLVAELQPSNYQFILQPIEINSLALLDAEHLVQQVKLKENVCDSLWNWAIQSDSVKAVTLRHPSIVKKVVQGLKLLGEDLEKLTRVRQIERHLDELKPEDIEYIIHDLFGMAIQQAFQAKTMNPYHPYLKSTTFQKLLNVQIKRKAPFSDIRTFIEKTGQTAWLLAEKNELYRLCGTAFEYFEQWDAAYQCYEKAYQVVSGTIYPAGIDSTFAFKMDSIAGKAFIAPERKLMAEMLVQQAKAIKTVHDSLRYFHTYLADSTNWEYWDWSDTLTARKYLDQSLQFIKTTDRLTTKRLRKMKSQVSGIHLSDLDFAAKQVFSELEAKMLAAKQLNAFDQNIRLYLAREIYYKTAELGQDSSLYARSVQEFENLVWVKNGIFVYFLYLGDAYMGVKDFQRAFNNYKTAETTLIQNAILSSADPAHYAAMPDSAPVNYELLSHCFTRQADAKIKLFEGKEALTLLRKAHNYTADSGRKTMITNLIDLVNWDDGNVLAMNLRQKATEHITMGDYKSASAVSLQLLGILWTQRTQDEINNQIAMLDFQHLDRKDAGIERLRQVITPMPTDSDGAPVDPVNQLYFKNYGRMCFDFGMRFLNQHDDRKTAYIYFYQATRLQWYGRPKAFLQLAALSEFDPRETIRLGFIALKEAQNLSPGEKRQVAELLSNAYQKEAKFKEARTWYRMSLDRTWCESGDES